MNSTGSKHTVTKTLQGCGLVAGPLFVLLIVIQVLTRTGYDLVSQPVSLLSLGHGGWIQIVNFLACGLLMIAFAVGIRRRLYLGRGGSWGPWFVGGFGAGLLIAGLFPPDAALGFPPGTPAGVPAVLTYRSILHGVGFYLSFASFTAACVVFALRDAAEKRWGAVAYTAATAIAAQTLSMWPGLQAIGLRDFVAALIAWTWTTILAARLVARVSTARAGH